MKNFFNVNSWIIALAICSIAFLGYKAIETGNCVEADLKSFRAGACREN